MIIEKIIIKNLDIKDQNSKDVGSLRLLLQNQFKNLDRDGNNKTVVIIDTKDPEFYEEDFHETTLKFFTDANGVYKRTTRRNGKRWILKKDLEKFGIKSLK